MIIVSFVGGKASLPGAVGVVEATGVAAAPNSNSF